MKIVIDDKIPYIQGALEPYAEVKYIPGSAIKSHDLKDADCLITRTRTHCNKELLHASKVKFIATATIGYDHIDTDYCKEAGIEWTNAPGCNSESVNQYVSSALAFWSDKNKISLKDLTIGIIGVGNVGSKVARTAEILGLKVLLNDPPRVRKEGQGKFVEIDQILEESNIITLHVPLNREGIDKTLHMAGHEFITRWKKPCLLINTCRGEVVNTKAIRESLKDKILGDCVIDCWENEPGIDLDFLNSSFIGTPHIAGYSRDGKANGTKQSVQAVSRFFNLGLDDWSPENIEKPHFPNILMNGEGLKEEEILRSAIQSTYDIRHDDQNLKSKPADFEYLRGNYPVRREFRAFTITSKNINTHTENKLRELGFTIRK